MKHLLPILVLACMTLAQDCSKETKEKQSVNGIDQPVISLNGKWKISLTPPAQHWDNGLEFGTWDDIQVPGECQMQGFAIKHDEPFVYKKQFEVPEDFAGKEIYLDFYGVYNHARVWVNGSFVREHYGGFTRWKCKITDLADPGSPAILTVEVVDRADDISYASGYAKHQIGGILRDVELSALPKQHFTHFHMETELDEAYRDAELKIHYELNNSSPLVLQLELKDELGTSIHSLEKEIQSQRGLFRIPVKNPRKWDAEHPHLYTLEYSLLENGTVTMSASEKIGFREVEVEGNCLLVNGMPVKLRGANRHDIHPTLGRITTPEYDLKDVLLAKECNMNFIRTSHYPPSETFLDYCDQYGIYVEDETAVCFVGSHRTENYRATGASQSDPEFRERYLSQLEEMVNHHRNHPSIILWSIGNENVFGDNFIHSFRWVKEKDPTRPVIYSYPGQVPDTLVNYEILSMHYPNWQGNLTQYDITTTGFDYPHMPALFDEWAHVACYNNYELKEDPNVRNFWGQSLDSMWSYTFEAEGALGGAIWCMLYETFALPENLPGFNQWWGILDKNVIPATYMGPCVGYGEWGIVDTWRRKKPEFWGTKKAYSPTRILVKQIDSFVADEELSVPIHNRFDHTNFNELRITWSYGEQSGILDKVDLAPHDKGSLSIPANSWGSGEELHIAFYQNDTLLVDRYQLLLGKRDINLPVCQPGELLSEEDSEKIILKSDVFSLTVNKATGLLEDVLVQGDTLIKSGPYLNLRIPGKAKQYSTIEMDDLAKKWECREFSYSVDQGIATIQSQGIYQKIDFSFTIRIDDRGLMEISYESTQNVIEKNIQEAGIKFLTGDSFEELSWKREPYFTAYPDTHMGRATGQVKLEHQPKMVYREKPMHRWEEDSKGFYYFGLNEELPYTNVVRSLKEHIFEYVLSTASESEISVQSDGSQACRFDRIQGKNTLIVNDQWDYNSLLWGNYMKRIPLENSFQGQSTLLIGKSL